MTTSPAGGWHETDELLHPRWRAVFNAAVGGAEISVPCPVCSSPTLYRWYLLESERPRVLRGLNYAGPGRLWEWCASCLTFEHYQDAYVPEWWTSPYSVEEASLRYDPGPIEEVRSSRGHAS